VAAGTGNGLAEPDGETLADGNSASVKRNPAPRLLQFWRSNKPALWLLLYAITAHTAAIGSIRGFIDVTTPPAHASRTVNRMRPLRNFIAPHWKHAKSLLASTPAIAQLRSTLTEC
jgi:hypothetical protein